MKNILSVCLAVTFISFTLLNTLSWNTETVLRPTFKPAPEGGMAIKVTKKPSRNITILAWNSYWVWPDYGLGEGNLGFITHNCAIHQCYLTTNKGHLKKADLILMHGTGSRKSDILQLKKTLKKRRQSSNGWPLVAFFDKESPK